MAEDRHIEGQQLQQRLVGLAKKWSKGKATLKQIVGLNEEEMYSIASQGYLMFLQGKTEQARVIFEGLVAIDPKNAYYYRALGSIYWRLKKPKRAIKQFTYAIRVSPAEISSYINRAEVHVANKDFDAAKKDLRIALSKGTNDVENAPLVNKARAMMLMLG